MNDNLTRVCSLLGRATERVVILSAYIGAATLERLLDAVPEGVTQKAVFVRWAIGDIADGATDWQVWDVAKARAVPLYACPRLHAKVYVSDGCALVGSANATASGLGLGVEQNLEVMVPFDAESPEVAQVLTVAEQESTEAPPIGAEVTGSGAGAGSLVWVPEVDPEVILDVLQGRQSHSRQTRSTCAILGIDQQQGDDITLRDAVRETTVFRVVMREFDTRPMPMTLNDLRNVLAKRLGRTYGTIPAERLVPLVRWLARYGANTHAVTTPGDAVPTLYPGRRLASYQFRRKESEGH